jgi:hypothetical protein
MRDCGEDNRNENHHQLLCALGIETTRFTHAILHLGIFWSKNASRNGAESSGADGTREPPKHSACPTRNKVPESAENSSVVVSLFVDRCRSGGIVRMTCHSAEHNGQRGGDCLLRRCRVNSDLLADLIHNVGAELLLYGVEYLAHFRTSP